MRPGRPCIRRCRANRPGWRPAGPARPPARRNARVGPDRAPLPSSEMSMLLALVRGRLRIPLLWLLIAALLGAGIISLATHQDSVASTHAASGATGVLIPEDPSSTTS